MDRRSGARSVSGSSGRHRSDGGYERYRIHHPTLPREEGGDFTGVVDVGGGVGLLPRLHPACAGREGRRVEEVQEVGQRVLPLGPGALP